MKYVLVCIALIAGYSISGAQILSGVVVDSQSKSPLAYVHIGVFKKNMGVISRDDGTFTIDLSEAEEKDSVGFSMVGYNTLFLTADQLNTDSPVKIQLQPVSYQLQEVVITGERNVPTEIFGRHKPTKTTTGQSGLKEFGFGGEWGILIKHQGKRYVAEEISFHMRFNTVDSVLFRLNLYNIDEDGKPHESILKKDLFVKSYKKDKWITCHVEDRQIVIADDIIATYEFVRIWYSEKGNNTLFFTHGDGYPEGRSYARASSLDEWRVDESPPIAMYIKGQITE